MLMAATLVLLGLFLMPLGVLLLFFPRRVGRKKALLVIAAGFVTMVVGGVLVPEPTEEERLARQEAREQREQEQAEEQQRQGEAREQREQEQAEERQRREEEERAAAGNRVREAVVGALGRRNRDGAPSPRVSFDEATGRVSVNWAINENLTEGMTKRGAQLDIVHILEAVVDSRVPFNAVDIEGTYSMVDTFGNASEQSVVSVTYSRETVTRINFDNFLTENAYVIADGKRIHPAFVP